MKISIINGRPAILTDCGCPIVTDITCGIGYTEGEEKKSSLLPSDSWTLTEENGTYITENSGSRLVFTPEGKGITVKCTYVHTGEDVSRTDYLVALGGTFVKSPKVVVGADMREVNGNKSNEMLTSVYTYKEGDEFTSCEFGDFVAFTDSDDNNYVVGVVTADEYFSGVYFTGSGAFEARGFTEHHPTEKGKTLVSDTFCILPVSDIVHGCEEFCDVTVKHLADKPRLKFDTPTGYCTWYYFLSEINQDIIGRAVEDVVTYKEQLPVKYVQIDDGWQVCYGQWEPKDTFSDGMKACADKIRAEGFTPGLWFAPLWARIAQVAKDHPEYFAKERGTGKQTLCFDYSVPGAVEYMKEVFRRATYDWGYEYLKLDLMSTCLGDYEYSHPDFNSLKNYKACMKLIKETVPEGTFLLGCTAPFLPSVGFVDGMRVGCDIFEDWNSVKDCMIRVLKRYFYNNRFFINDADCLIIRKSENEDGECQRNCKRNDEEIKSFISATAASGGILMFSDKLRLLYDEQRKLLSYMFPINTQAATPLDFTTSYIPGILDCGVKDKTRTVVLINWLDEETVLGYDADGCHAYEFWSGKYLGVVNGKYESKIAPHCCEVLHFTEADAPITVVGSENTLVPSANQTFNGDSLDVTFAKKGERLVVRADSITADACDVESIADGLFRITQKGDTMTASLKK